MHRAFANPRLALILRRLRGRFGIAAPRVAIRTHVPLHWRALAAVVVLALALALAGWIYDAGRRFAGFDRSLSDSEITALRDRSAELESEVNRLRSITNAAENTQQIDKTAIDQLTRQVKTLADENAHLKESLAVFENLAKGGDKGESLSLTNLRIEPDGQPGRYRYRVLASWRGADPKREFKGALQFQVSVRQPDGQNVMIVVPRPDDSEAGKFAVSFRNLRSLEGSFRVPPDVKVGRVEVRLMQDGSVKASQSIAL
jgi:hypothetical protein